MPGRGTGSRAGLRVSCGHGSSQNDHRSTGSAARYHPRGRWVSAPSEADRRSRCAGHHPGGEDGAGYKSLPSGDRGRVGAPRCARGSRVQGRGKTGRRVEAETQPRRCLLAALGPHSSGPQGRVLGCHKAGDEEDRGTLPRPARGPRCYSVRAQARRRGWTRA